MFKFFLVLVLGVGFQNAVAAEVPAKYFCTTKLEFVRTCLQQEIKWMCSFLGCAHQVVCTSYSPDVVKVWRVNMVADGKTYSGGEFESSDAATRRLNQLIDQGICQ